MERLSRERFVDRYGGVYEHSPWVAEQAWDRGDVSDPASLKEALADCVDRAGDDAKLALIRAHPDLAGRAAVRGELTAESTDEQQSAGIDQCTAEEFARFEALNAAYKARFGFPFVMAVRGRHRAEILAAFETRLENDQRTEFRTAIAEVHKIAAMGLAALASEAPA